MRVLLDTDICIYIINRKYRKLLDRLRNHAVGEVGISAISYAELRFGIEHSAQPERNLKTLERFLLPIEIAPFDAGAGRWYGRVRSQLQRAGRMIGGNDLLIAAHAVSLGATLVTNNTREFQRVEHLTVENWT